MSEQAKPTRDAVDYMNKFICVTKAKAEWIPSLTTRYELALARACAALVERDEKIAQLLAACEAVMDWYDRDGSVGGAVDPMEQLSAAIKAARGMT